jgi:hypothetical protein
MTNRVQQQMQKCVSNCLLRESYVEETIYIAPVHYLVHNQSECVEVEDEQVNQHNNIALLNIFIVLSKLLMDSSTTVTSTELPIPYSSKNVSNQAYRCLANQYSANDKVRTGVLPQSKATHLARTCLMCQLMPFHRMLLVSMAPIKNCNTNFQLPTHK